MPMFFIESTLGTGPREPETRTWQFFERVLAAIMPMANPDFGGRYGEVRKWWLEIDETGQPRRELGFNAAGAVIVAGPLGENLGYWTDNEVSFKVEENPKVGAAAFESAWQSFAIEFEGRGK